MPTVVSDRGGRDFEPAPEGLFSAVCCDVVDKGDIETKYRNDKGELKILRKVQVRWQLGEEAGFRDDGKPWLVVKTYTASLNERATLRQDLERWRGKRFTEEELKGFDLDKLINAPCLIQLIHNDSEVGGRVYANVEGITPLPTGMPRPTVQEYVMVRDREEAQENSTESLVQISDEAAFDTLPSAKRLTLPDKASELQALLQELGHPVPSSALVKLTQKHYPGIPFASLGEKEQDRLLGIARAMLKVRLAEQAAAD